MRVLPLVLLTWLGMLPSLLGRDIVAFSSTRPAQTAQGSENLTNIMDCLANVRSRTNPLVPLRVEGTITLVDKTRNLVVFQDNTAAIAIQLPSTNLTLKAGQRILVEGNGLLPFVRSFPEYPDQPTGWEYLDSFEAPSNVGNYYLARIRGYLHPPVTGRYLFWIAADDAGEFWLSPDADPGKIQKTATLTIGNSTGEREWTRYPSQGSQYVDLKAGETYYVEALHIEGTGRDSIAVAWQGPGIERAVIDGRYLTPPLEPPSGLSQPTETIVPTNGLLREYWTNFFVRDFQALHTRSRKESIVRVPAVKVTVLGETALPVPTLLLPGTSPETVTNLQWTEVEGDVSFVAGAEDNLQLEVKTGAADLVVHVLNWNGQSTERFKNARVRVRGVLEHAYNANSELTTSVMWVPDSQQLTVLSPTVVDGNELNRVLISEIDPSNPRMSLGRRVTVRGRVVSQAANGQVVFRGNDKYQGYSSADGINWVPIGKPVEIAMSNSVLIGVALASHLYDESAVATFDHLQGPGTNWHGADIDSPGQPGNYTVSNSVFTVRGSGKHIWRAADQQFFLYQALEGEGEITAHLADLQGTDPNAQTGVMIRESLDRGAGCAAVLMTPAFGTKLQCRRIYGEYPVDFLTRADYRKHPWFKLERKQNCVLVETKNIPDKSTEDEFDITGTLAWKDGAMRLTEVSFQTAPTNSLRPLTYRRQLRHGISIDGYLAEAQRSSQPYLRGYLEASEMRGVVTFCDQVLDKSLMFIQESNCGLQVAWSDSDVTPRLQVGQLVDTGGRSPVGQFPVTLDPTSIRVTGWGTMPKPAHYSSDLVTSGTGHGNWVEAEGVIRSKASNGVFNLMAKDGSLPIWISHSDTNNASRYINALVRVRGVLSVASEHDALLLVPSPEFVEIQEQPPADPFATPIFPIRELADLNIKPELLREKKVVGVVTCLLKRGLYLQDDTGGAYVQLPSAPEVKPGDLVEVAGFPSGHPSVVLTDAQIRKTGTRPIPAPILITSKESEDANDEASVVRAEAILLEQRNGREGQVLILQAGPRIIRAALASGGEGVDHLPGLQPGSRVSVTGVCHFQSGGEAAEPQENGEQSLAPAFQIWLRSPADVTLLQRPPWWTWKQAAAVLCIFACGLLGTLIWVRMLRRRVAQRTRELQVTMSRLEKETHTSAVLAERDRLAGEIHDSLEQGLTAIMLQLDAAGKLSHNPAEVRRYLGMARSMAGFSRAEVQHAVWDLQSPLLENADLGTALTHVASEISAGDLQQVTVKINGPVHPLPSSTEHHLLRIGQEAITNAVKHGQPRNIQVTLDYSDSELLLTVKDDGHGFAPDNVANGAKDGHFGLQGIRARARKINSELAISSQPGRGATVIITVPLNGNGTLNNP